MDETNITVKLEGQWHKVAAAPTLKLGGDITLGESDFAAINGKAVVVSGANDGRALRVRVVNEIEAARLQADYEKGR